MKSRIGSVTCIFLHKSNGEKSCHITFFDKDCQHEQYTMNSSTTGDEVVLHVPYLSKRMNTYCFIVTASNVTVKVIVNGTYVVQLGE